MVDPVAANRRPPPGYPGYPPPVLLHLALRTTKEKVLLDLAARVEECFRALINVHSATAGDCSLSEEHRIRDQSIQQTERLVSVPGGMNRSPVALDHHLERSQCRKVVPNH